MYNKSNIYVLLSLSFWAGVTKILQTGWFNKHLFLTVLEGRKSTIKTLTNLVLVRHTSWFTDSWLLTMSSHGRRGEGALWGLFCKGIDPIHEDSHPYNLIFVTPWTVACQAPLFMELSKQKYWSGLPFPSPVYNLITSPKISPLNTTTLGVGISTYEFWDNIKIQSITAAIPDLEFIS